ncbi:MAG TPA: MFS transporter [Burkholderiales bacterium]|nr:MFS transporter [Burkholderiales bacterium]
MTTDARPLVPHRVGVYFAVVQLFFTLTWTVYVIFLPKLAAQAGIPKHWVVYILLLDQLVFVVMDYAMGVMADRVSKVLGRLGYIVLAVTLGSCLAFLLLPFAAPAGAAWLFLALTVLWAVSSSALRAPPLALLGKYAPQPAVPWLSALSLFGLGLAGAVSPYLTIVMRDLDPRLPFAISSIALALATAGIMWAERTLAKDSPSAAAATVTPKPNAPVAGFLIAALLVGIGFQIHFSLNTAGQYLKLAKPDQLPYLMPVFWIGFNVLMLPASLATKRYGGIAVACAGAVIAAIAAFGATRAGSLETLVALQFIAGGGWGCVLMSAVAAAVAIGHTGREGKLTGGLFSLLALAAFARIAILAAELNKDPGYAAAFAWAPVAAWAAGGLILLYLYATRPEARAVPA